MTKLTLDTNILFYAFDLRDPHKHAIARDAVHLCMEKGVPVALQCLSEFYRAATRKQLATPEGAAEAVYLLRRGLEVITPEFSDLDRAISLHQNTGRQFFDCLLVATVARHGCTHMLSEDFTHNSAVAGLLVLNPFQLRTGELAALLT